MAFYIYILYVCIVMSLSGTDGTIFDLLKGVAIRKESYLRSIRVRSLTECSSVCQSGCKAINYIDGTCELHKSQDCPFEYNSTAVVINESVKAFVKREINSKEQNDTINMVEHGGNPCGSCLLPPKNTRRIISGNNRSLLECESFDAGASVENCPVSKCLENGWSTINFSCSLEDCFIESSSYSGKITCTRSGITCQKWYEISPHVTTTLPTKPEDRITNYCRDPDGQGVPWCYTTDPVIRWEPCPVQKCP